MYVLLNTSKAFPFQNTPETRAKVFMKDHQFWSVSVLPLSFGPGRRWIEAVYNKNTCISCSTIMSWLVRTDVIKNSTQPLNSKSNRPGLVVFLKGLCPAVGCKGLMMMSQLLWVYYNVLHLIFMLFYKYQKLYR